MRKIEESSGVIALEACLSLSIFMFLVLMMYSFLALFEAQYTIEHAMLEAGKSMSVETYATNKIGGNVGEAFKDSGTIGSMIRAFGLKKFGNSSDFAQYSRWDSNSTATVQLAKKRVTAYMGGESNADALLRLLRVEGGLGGLNFDGTEVKGDDLEIHISYTSKMLFNYLPFGLGEIEVKLGCRHALWK